jgi:hypothetical protein
MTNAELTRGLEQLLEHSRTRDEHERKQDERIARLATVAEALIDAANKDAENIRAIARIADTHTKQIAELRASITAITTEWQAYLRRIPPQ